MLFNSLLLGSLVSLVTGAAVSKNPRDVLKNKVCNFECNKKCWSQGFDINTNHEDKWPITGKTRIYHLELTEPEGEWIGPDGVPKLGAMLVNGNNLGPVIQANWGDRIDVTVTNNLKYNGTSMHWHGFHQINSNIMDGTAGVTECPIPPGSSKTYSFIATQHGSSWYHSHISSQYASGIIGAIQINGPASANYEKDLGVFPISDWYYESTEHLLMRVMDPKNPFRPNNPGSPPTNSNVFFNGTNINPSGPGGEYAKVKLEKGKRHRLRLINTSTDTAFTISIVGHKMKVIEADFTPVQPHEVDNVFMGIGQRYDVIIEGNQAVGNYWINATLSKSRFCGESKNPFPAAILTYDGADEDALPTDPGTPVADTLCQDDTTSFKPIVDISAPKEEFVANNDTTLGVQIAVDQTISRVFWNVDASPIDVLWEKPTLEYVREGNSSFPHNANIVTLPDENKWSFWVIQNLNPPPHPMHLHGHDFLILGHSDPIATPTSLPGPRFFNPETDMEKLNFDKPLRRDTTMLPGFGWLVVAFEAGTNPGVWPFHCHIPWHMSQGLSVQFLELPEKIKDTQNLDFIEPNCKNWDLYQNSPAFVYKKVDSGL